MADEGNKMIQLVYTLEKIPENQKIIFLAGPTHRVVENQITPPSWRDEAVAIFAHYGYDGCICIPEWRNNVKPTDWTYSRQVDWESDGLSKAKTILFWIPRDMKILPALTTNIEFGTWMASGKIVVGAPDTATHMEYIREKCSRFNVPWTTTLDGCVLAALEKTKATASFTWFTSDTHFGEARTLQLSKRPFVSTAEMDATILRWWNENITDNDTVYHLGDFGNTKYLSLLSGKEIKLLPGNYDKPDTISGLTADSRVSIIENNTVIQLSAECSAALVHEPEKAIGENFFLFGHIHKLQMVKQNGLNIGVDCHNFKPVSVADILFFKNAISKHYDKNVFMGKLGEQILPEGQI